MANSKAVEAHFSYTTSTPSVALVDQDGKVTAMSEGEAIIRVHMDQDTKDWYAAADREYKVIVKNGTLGQIITADRQTPLTLVAQADGKITVNFNGGITLSGDIYYSINGGALQTISRNTKGSYDITVVLQHQHRLKQRRGGCACRGEGSDRRCQVHQHSSLDEDRDLRQRDELATGQG